MLNKQWGKNMAKKTTHENGNANAREAQTMATQNAIVETSANQGSFRINPLIDCFLSALKGVALVATNLKLHVSYANPYACEILGLNIQQIESGIGLLPAVMHKRILAELSKSSTEFILQYALEDQLRTLQVNASCLKDEAGEYSGYVLHMHDITDRVAIEQELRHTETMLRSLINASPDFICFKDGKGRWLEANSSGLELFQLDRKNYLKKTDTELADNTHPIYREVFLHSQASDEHAWNTREMVREEETIPLPQGGEKVFDVIKVPLFTDDGRRQGLVTLGRDITERKVAEKCLNDRTAILDAMIFCDWLLHSSESWQKVSPSVLELLGTAAGFDRALLFQMHTKDGSLTASATQLFRWSLPGQAMPEDEYKAIHFEADGCGRWLSMLQQGNPVFGTLEDFPPDERKFLQHHGTQTILLVPIFAGDQWWGVILVDRCHALSKISSQELGAFMAAGRSFGVAIQREASGRRLSQAMIAFESAAEGIMITDEDTRIIAINKSFTEISGYTEEDVLGHIPNALHSDKHDEHFYQEMWSALTRDGRWRGEIWNKRKSGETYPESLTLTVVKDADGKVINYVGVFADISESRHSQNRLYELANHDSLTGLPNRRLFNELMGHGIKRAERKQNQIALLFVDLDRFKAINDTLGHEVGDKLLFQVSRRISCAVRESDAVARVGGDEFLVMMDHLRDAEDAAMVAKKIINTLQTEFIIDGRELFIGASIGIAIYPEDSTDVDGLIKAADIAMYQVKHEGKNNYCFYSADLSENAVERFTLENQLRRALERNQFEVFYQPQISLESGRIVGAEALIRWRHPELGMVSPAKFIPLAEETGLIVPIGEWVLCESARQAMQWTSQGHALQWISVNVSGVQIQRSNFPDTVYGILVETGCEPGLLELEITESTVMHNTEFVIGVFDRIKRLGVRLAIDDFGTGYSSLSHLKRLPLDKLKIDQSFVRGLPHNANDAAIASAINALAHNLGFTVIAEGVETTEQADFLRQIGCNEAQGYLYSHPVPASEFALLLETDGLKGQ